MIKYFIIKNIKKITIGLILLSFLTGLSAQNNTLNINNNRLKGIIISEIVMYFGSMTGLYYLWYKDYPQSSFHFINDNEEWLQMDKIGHSTTAYYIGLFWYESYRWCGVSKKKAIWYGGSIGWVLLSSLEIFDGFSAEWGASLGDIAANTLGTAMFIGQQLTWDQQRVLLKFSVHRSKYAQYSPDLLGENFQQNILKDYNGQTYWLSANIYSFLKKNSRFPKWLNVAVGYSAEGMTGGYHNRSEYNGNPIPEFDRYRQFYLSLDIDLTRIQTGSRFVNLLLDGFGFIKFPFPAIEFNNKDGVKFKALYF